ncbi:MAG: Altered inheritance of mitochondria protein 18 mitochondrial [Geoglossum simile]|nr:MAG: Altered inheritance of mitochondria protein 18 mitochondrial [Geoglossum simile]
MNAPTRLRRPILRCFQCLQHRPPPSYPGIVLRHQRQRLSSASPPPSQPTCLDSLTRQRLDAEHRAYYQRRMYFAATGAVVCMIAIWVLATSVELPPKAEENEAATPGARGAFGGAKHVVLTSGGVEQVSTGTSTVPTFPKTLTVNGDNTEYQLLGLGIRTVSFLRIQVYVVGLYVATSDMPALQALLVRQIVPNGSTLLPDEREVLKEKLLDGKGSMEVWDRVLRAGGVRMVTRIVPTRSTEWGHLRDGWVRGVMSRSGEYKDEESFGVAVGGFKALFPGRKSLPKGRTMLLLRDGRGVLEVRAEGGDGEEAGWMSMGNVQDERVGRLVWLGYLGGETVASEEARRSIVEGVLGVVERPVGTV